MRAYPEVPQCGVGLAHGALRDAARDQDLRGVGVPLLCPEPDGVTEQQERGEHRWEAHREAISRRLRRAASAALLLTAACVDLTIPGPDVVDGADLLTLPLEAGAPPPGTASFYVANARTELRRLLHPDAFNSLYLQVEFPTNALASLDDVPLGPGDSVLVTLEPEPGGYGVTVRPSGLQFASGRGPTATFVYAAFGDLSVADGSATYASRAAYAAALAIWEHVGADRWERVAGSTTGNETVTARLPAPGTYLVAARR